MKRNRHSKEDLRQLTHLLVGAAAVIVVHYVGFNSALLLMAFIFLSGLTLANFKMLGGKVKAVDHLLQLMDREDFLPAQGAMFFAAGILILLTFARSLEFGLAIILLHSAGDAFATIIGIRFKQPLPWNKNKSWSGLAAFIVFGAIGAWLFIPVHQAILYAVLLGVVESLPLWVDDNISVPVAALALRGVGI